MTGVLFLDLRKAFNMVDHEIAISRLSKFNLSTEVLAWFRSYLSKRQQITKVNGIDSDFKPVVRGVPRGQSLGPSFS